MSRNAARLVVWLVFFGFSERGAWVFTPAGAWRALAMSLVAMFWADVFVLLFRRELPV
jgi:hypothetical protein